MRQVHSENTKPEMLVRCFLHKQGFRYRVHVKDLPGKPDIVLPRFKTIVEIRGCFWHHHEGCKQAVMPSSHSEYWREKFMKNVSRDKKTEAELKALGWNLIVIWECELKKTGFLESLPSMIRNATLRPAEDSHD